MALSDIINSAALELGLKDTSSVIGSTDLLTKQLLALLQEEGQDTRDRYTFPALSKEGTFTIVSSQDSYALPGDFNFFLADTEWDRTNSWPLMGPLTPQMWQEYKSGLASVAPRRIYRIKGYTLKQFFIHPVPTTSGNILAFEYLSRNWCRPRTWETGIAYAANTYTFYDGNIYSTASGGTTGATAPTHTTGSASDGGITWTFYSLPYEQFLADTDVGIIEERILKLGLKWRWKAARRFDYTEEKSAHMLAIKDCQGKLSSASTISLGQRRGWFFPTYMNVPEGNWPI